MNPQSVHKLPEHCLDVLLTSKCFYTTDTNRRNLYIISRDLSQVQPGEKAEFNKEAIIGKFSFERREEVINDVYIVMAQKNAKTSEKKFELTERYSIPSQVEDITMELPQVDFCTVVTNFGIYQVFLRSVSKRLAVMDNFL